MARFLLQRLGAAIVLLLVLSFLIFVLQQVSPGDPARAYLGANASAADVAAQRHALGLDQPLATQYLRFLVNAVQGDLGRSLRTRHDVTADIAAYLPATVELVLSAFVVALVLAAAFALSGALRWRAAAPLRGLLLVAAMAPPFLLALGGIVVFYARLGWLPNNGRGGSGAADRPACWSSTASCMGSSTRRRARSSTWCCRPGCWPSPRRSPSAGSSGPAWT